MAGRGTRAARTWRSPAGPPQCLPRLTAGGAGPEPLLQFGAAPRGGTAAKVDWHWAELAAGVELEELGAGNAEQCGCVFRSQRQYLGIVGSRCHGDSMTARRRVCPLMVDGDAGEMSEEFRRCRWSA